MSDPIPGERHRGLQIAATLCYVMAALHVVFVTIAAVQVSRSPDISAGMVYLALSAIAFGVAGLLLRKERRSGAVIAVLASAIRIALQLSMSVLDVSLWMVADVAILALVAAGWRHLRPVDAERPPA